MYMKKILLLILLLFSFSVVASADDIAKHFILVNTTDDIAKLEQDCNLNKAEGCVLLGNAYKYGNGVKQDYSQAKQLYGKACDLGVQLGCDGYKILNEKSY